MMRKLALLVVMIMMMAAYARAEIVDRTIARVNDHLITWSDLDQQMRFEALENRRSLSGLTAAERQPAFEHLVRQAMLRQQMQGLASADTKDIDLRMAELRHMWQMEADDKAWAATLSRYGITGEELRSLVADQLDVLHYLEAQVRPLVRITRAEIEGYYDTILAPKVMAAGQTPEPLDKVRNQIRELLVEQQTNREMEQWLEKLRAQSQIQILWEGVH